MSGKPVYQHLQENCSPSWRIEESFFLLEERILFRKTNSDEDEEEHSGEDKEEHSEDEDKEEHSDDEDK